jgi:cold shock CspA family protein
MTEIHWVRPEQFREQDRRAAEERIVALAGEQRDLLDVRITARPTAHHRRGAQEVRITCRATGKEIVASRTRDEAGLALNETVDAFEREVWRMRHRRMQQREERPAAAPELGVVDRVFRDAGYGFIVTDGGETVYFHRNALHGGLALEALEEGQRVGLNFEGGAQGLQATAVRPPPLDPRPR